MKKKRLLNLAFVFLVVILFLISGVYALLNPATIYCENMGYKSKIISTEEGDVSMCILPNGKEINAGDFLKGKVGAEYSYCVKHGYLIKTISDGEKCSSIFSYECAVCILANGEEIEVTKLMNASLKESICGDGFCAILEENYKLCPIDCVSGSEDNYCDKVSDGLCDPDCISEEDPDCPGILSEPKCVYDGICPSECIGTGDSDCLCINPESQDCKLASPCNKDGICSGAENNANCPQECMVEKALEENILSNENESAVLKRIKENSLFYFILFFFLVLIFLIGLILKKREKN